MYSGHGVNHLRRFVCVALASSITAFSLACSDSRDISTEPIDPSKGNLAGKITYKGKPFAGYILVQSEDNRQTAKAAFNLNGSYIVTGVPIGKVKLGLVSPPHVRRRPGQEGQDSKQKKFNMIPSQYNDPSKSGLTVEIHSGRNQFDVDLP